MDFSILTVATVFFISFSSLTFETLPLSDSASGKKLATTIIIETKNTKLLDDREIKKVVSVPRPLTRHLLAIFL
ncbi:hypothetical protein GKR62_08495 [Yersinia pseudotuberculosis]|nr:hypothetical protein [Yersinia pseudotuberculosis]